MTKKSRQNFWHACKNIFLYQQQIFICRASKNLVGPGHPRPSARHCPWGKKLWANHNSNSNM